MTRTSLLRRRVGVLLHPTALPGSVVCGALGASARSWIQALAENGIGLWQILPLSPPDGTGSPYSSPSSFAINPWLLDAKDLSDQGFLQSRDLQALPGAEAGCAEVDFSLADRRASCLARQLCRSWDQVSHSHHAAFERWRRDQSRWLQDHAAFMVLREQHEGLPWWQWPRELAVHDQNALGEWREAHQNRLLEQELLQWHLSRQWMRLRKLANELSVEILGDLPFYVARDSADVWSHRSLFSIAADGRLREQSGVPPDYFSETGQLWGTPVYRWSRHRSTGFRWWRDRLRRQWQLADRLRLDHFRALASYWSVPGGDTTAMNGAWRRSPGRELLSCLRRDAGGLLPLVAEDLGVITPDVERLRDRFRLPGMKVLQFAFDGNPHNPYLPSNIHGTGWVVYPGTHDNPTSLGWWQRLDDDSRARFARCLNCPVEAPGWQLLELGLSSSAQLVVAPLQDLLHLDDAARFNTPGTVGGNWNWRLPVFDDSVAGALQGYGLRAEVWSRR
ncbi:MAG: 4-alpha-glucanotransferase [Cyanobium sp. ARS6]|uniref:4-alpha-glucanotransferase n=1 Tax=Synechococcus sp. MIT S9507 TaxID=3082544 RepID=UPI000C41B268|nr:4-alpha-glucanotransferase [Cyanobium sp. ARS6]